MVLEKNFKGGMIEYEDFFIIIDVIGFLLYILI